MWISWQAVVVAIIAVAGAVITAIWGYFSVMNDLRNRDGTIPCAREQWNHILGLLAYFMLGLILFATTLGINIIARLIVQKSQVDHG